MKTLKKSGMLAILLAVIFLFSACQPATPTLDPSLMITQVAATVVAEMTRVAALTPSATPTLEPTATATELPPTPTLSPAEITPSPTATSAVVPDAKDDNAKYVADVTFPDGAYVNPASVMVKTWTIQNTGKTTWKKSYRLAYLEGLTDQAKKYYVLMPKEVAPFETVNISVTIEAPTASNTYYSYWRLVNSDGEPFGEELSMKIFVIKR